MDQPDVALALPFYDPDDPCPDLANGARPALLAHTFDAKIVHLDREHVYFMGQRGPCPCAPAPVPMSAECSRCLVEGHTLRVFRRVPRCGGEVETLVSGVLRLQFVAGGGGSLYLWQDEELRRLSADAPGAEPATLEGLEPGCGAGAAADDAHLYVADACEGAILRWSHDDTVSSVLFDGVDLRDGFGNAAFETAPVAVGDGSLYFAATDGVHRAGLEGGAPRLLHATSGRIGRMVATEGAIFFTRRDGGSAVVRAGAAGHAETLAEGRLVAVQDGHAYFLGSAEIRVTRVEPPRAVETVVERLVASADAFGPRLYYTANDVVLTALRETARTPGTEDRAPPLWESNLSGSDLVLRHGASDPDGNVVVMGIAVDDVDLGEGPLPAARATVVFRLDGSGHLGWARAFDESWRLPACWPPQPHVRSVCLLPTGAAACLAVDGEGGIGAVMTDVSGDPDVGPAPTLLRYLTASGELSWSREVPHRRCAGAPGGGIVVAGHQADTDALSEVISFAPSGDERWRVVAGRLDADARFELRELSMGRAGVALLGALRGGGEIGSKRFSAPEGEDAALLVWLHPDGSPAWHRVLEGVQPRGVAADAAGLLVYGDAPGFVDLGRGREPVAWPGRTNTVIARYAASGALQWWRCFEGFSSPLPDARRFVAHPEGGAVLGIDSGAIPFYLDDDLAAGAVARGPFVARLTPDGDVEWSRQLPGRPLFVASAPRAGGLAGSPGAVVRLGP